MPPSLELRNGVRIPILGLGTYLVDNEIAERVVLDALISGYRHIDTASFYGNERAVGAALRRSGLPREEVFVTTKVWNSDHGLEPAQEAFRRSLRLLGMDYVDLYLIHWPMPARLDTWKALEALYEEGLCRAIGVSNFVPRHLEEIERAGLMTPMVDQVEMHPFLYRRDILEYCQERGIQVEAFSPLARGRRLEDPRLAEVARRSGRTPAQVMLRWGVQKGMVVIPKSVTPSRLQENTGVFEFALSPEDMDLLDGMNENWRTTTWDPYSFP